MCVSPSAAPVLHFMGFARFFRPSKVFFSFKSKKKVDEGLLRISSKVVQEPHHKVEYCLRAQRLEWTSICCMPTNTTQSNTQEWKENVDIAFIPFFVKQKNNRCTGECVFVCRNLLGMVNYCLMYKHSSNACLNVTCLILLTHYYFNCMCSVLKHGFNFKDD